MKTIVQNGSVFDVSEEGYLVKFPEELDKNWIDYVRQCEGIGGVTPEHEKVVSQLWRYYKENGAAPRHGAIAKITGFPLKRIYEMFPSGASGAGRMAGFPGKIC